MFGQQVRGAEHRFPVTIAYDSAAAGTQLGAVRRLTGDYRGAAEALEAALDIYRDLGSRGVRLMPSTKWGSRGG